MVVFFFVFFLTNTVFALDPISSVIKRLWCIVFMTGIMKF